ncbi:MAG: hypothetical protein HYV60_17285 [Planctomycetia bacterium]|nr:hypothetical protein [Planctomycetia bacterium]
MTIADAPHDVDRTALTEDQRTLPAEEGAANVSEIAALLREHCYNGPITLAPNANCFTGMKNDDILKQCRTVLDELSMVAKAVAAGSDK